ncbi:baseplate J/gp47 family protein [uncultured Exiguobacterium sp.]|uniref:baseplate J/gp47 family protein n=1 Tax=uncultured Exiguobacterium sp. TaxID=202669 RepID=UPI0025FEE4E9|nr:baseplate J/gp47 family protein [uncultured Exiguobacterium sp.]
MDSEFDIDLSIVTPTRSPEDIHAEMLQLIQENDPQANVAVGEPVWDATRPAAIIAATQSSDLAYGMRAAIPQLSYGEFLDEHAKDVLPDGRKPGVKAIVPVTLSSNVALTVPQGTLLLTGNDLAFVLEADVVLTPPEVQPDPDYPIPGEATATATASEMGAIYNVVPGAINTVDGDLKDLVSVTNGIPTTAGVDQESDADLKARMLTSAQNQSGAGNPEDYKAWALEATGITKAKVFRADPSPGIVTVLVAQASGMPTAGQVAEAQSKINARASLIANNIVLAPTALPVNVAGDVVLIDGASMSDLVTSFSQALQGYLANLAFTGEVIRYTQILNLLLDQPLLVDVSGFTVNGASANLVVGVKQIATLGTVTFT